MPRFSPTLVLTLLLASCGLQPAPLAEPTSAPSPTAAATPILHAPEIRFALIGEPRDVNVWELFDESGASYADYALRFEYWPRLYHLAPPAFDFRPLAADGMPSAVTRDGDFFSAAVKLRTDLKWTDGSAFTAEDVVFTANTALAFELGFDWGVFYSREYIERVEAVDPFTVRFVFKKQPNVAVWQYGALQGVIVQKTYWESRIGEAAGLLPDQVLRTELMDARDYFKAVQTRVAELNTQAIAMGSIGQDNRQVVAELTRKQQELIYAQNTLDELLGEFSVKMTSAHQALYAVDDNAEPTLGTWIPAGKQNEAWVNKANPDFPFIQPNFDRAVYHPFVDEAHAGAALQNDEVDLILQTDHTPAELYSSELSVSPSGAAHFLIFNPASPTFADAALRQAFACMLWFPTRSTSEPLSGFVIPENGFWRDPEAVTPCSDLTDANITDLRWDRIVKTLKSAGYTWEIEPTKDMSGEGLRLPNGEPFPPVHLLGLSTDDITPGSTDPGFIAESAKELGISMTFEYAGPEAIRYEVFSSKKYDVAILGWNLSLYPGYLCAWFQVQGQFDYGSDGLGSECEVLAIESDLEAAQRHIFEIQSLLVADLPFIPLYADVTYDAYRNIRYPFENVLGGLGGLYGAPSYAMPAN